VLKPAAFMPATASSNASVAFGFMLAPLMLQRSPMGARFKAPPLNDTVPAELAGLPPRVQRALGFAPLTADPPSACGGCARLRATRLTTPCRRRTSPRVRDGEAQRHLLPRISPEPSMPRDGRPPALQRALRLLGAKCKQSYPHAYCCAAAMLVAMSASAATRARPSRRRSAAESAASASLPPLSTAADTAPISRLQRTQRINSPRLKHDTRLPPAGQRTAPRRPARPPSRAPPR